jgi:predicted Zn-dependent protease
MQYIINDSYIKQISAKNLTKNLVSMGLLVGLVGCQLTPTQTPPKNHSRHHPPIQTRPAQMPQSSKQPPSTTTAQPEFGYPPLESQKLPSLPPQPQVVLRDGRNIPLVQTLMTQGVQQLQLGQLDNAEDTFDRVQRIAPQNSSVYARLSEIALKKNDGVTAEGMARRGLVLAKSPQQKAGFWQLIMLAGSMQSRTDIVNEAKGHLQNQ